MIRVEAMKVCYLDLPFTGKKGEINNSFIAELQESIRETFPITKGFKEDSEEATLTVYYPKGQVRATLFRCLVVGSSTANNNMTITYKKREEIGQHFYNRYYLHEREADIINGRYYEFILIDNALLIRELTEELAQETREMLQETIDTDYADSAKIEYAEQRNI